MQHPSPRRAAIQLLQDWQSAGLSHFPRPSEAVLAEIQSEIQALRDEAAGESGPAAASGPAAPLPPSAETPPDPRSSSPASSAAGETGGQAPERQLDQLARRVAACTRCAELAGGRTQTVFGVGDPRASVMFIGEAPGADEDRQGEPFVGKAGQLLEKIIEACGWKREQIYICNILRCRPPGNRTPLPEEAANCREYLDGQIAVVDPDYIVCWGSCAAQNLLDSKDSIGRMRQRWYQYGRAKVLCTYHPSYLLRNPAAKKPVWEDMKFLLAAMGLQPPS